MIDTSIDRVNEDINRVNSPSDDEFRRPLKYSKALSQSNPDIHRISPIVPSSIDPIFQIPISIVLL